MGICATGNELDILPLSTNYKTWFDKEHVNHFGRVSKPLARSRALSLIQKCSETRDPEYQYYAGILYERGYGVKRNYTNSFNYYLKAAKQNYIPAIERVALFYKNGVATEMDEKLSFQWYNRAAEEGSILSMKRLSSFYMEGIAVEKNEEKASYWLSRVNSETELDLQITGSNGTRSKKSPRPPGGMENKLSKVDRSLSWKTAKKSPRPLVGEVDDEDYGFDGVDVISEDGSTCGSDISDDEPENDEPLPRTQSTSCCDSNRLSPQMAEVPRKRSLSTDRLDKMGLGHIRRKRSSSTGLVGLKPRRKRRHSHFVMGQFNDVSQSVDLSSFKQHINQLKKEKKQMLKSLDEERLTHIRTQNLLRNTQRELRSTQRENNGFRKRLLKIEERLGRMGSGGGGNGGSRRT